jgi:hypothetical protein
VTKDQKKARERVAAAIKATASREQELGREGFAELPESIQSELAMLQAQCAPKDDTLEALLACEHLLKDYVKKLGDAVNMANQLRAEGSRRRARLVAGTSKRLVIGGGVLVVLAAAVLVYRQALAAKRDACQSAPACAQSGLCHAELQTDPALSLECRAGSEEHCRASSDCAKLGRCSLEQGQCVAASDADCRALAACRERGACSAKGGECVAVTARDCRPTKACVEVGHCTPVDGVCRADSDTDCRQSELCKRKGACNEVEGRCVVVPADFGK